MTLVYDPRVVSRPPGELTIAEQREEDAAWFEDWSWGRDASGLWCWPEPAWRVIVVRDLDASRMVDLIVRVTRSQLGHRGDCIGTSDWYVPALRWRALLALRPQMIATRLEILAKRELERKRLQARIDREAEDRAARSARALVGVRAAVLARRSSTP